MARMILISLCFFIHAILQADELSYSRDVRPILSDKCFFCHGPDEKNNRSKLRLDTQEGAYQKLKSGEGHAIVPGKPDQSELWARISSDDSTSIMPPPRSKLSLTSEEKAILKKWITQGAKYEPHWSFVPLPKIVPVPHIDSPVSLSPLDAFVLKKLQSHSMKPAPPADPLRWLRRVTLDLTGLPPSLPQIQEFESAFALNPSKAKEIVVDKLLASPAFGEHMAIPWLDAARYADTFGYHSDSDFTPWPYRDWVVSAFNEDMPYDRFLTLNLAGDLLPSAGPKEIIPTTFNRLHRITNEGGSVYLEFFVDGVADRVHTLGTSVLGLTMECARCHDHKYDPITQRDYYSLFAFFNSINETGVYNHGRITPPPSLLLPTPQQAKELEIKREAICALESKLRSVRESSEPKFQKWLKNPDETPLYDCIGHFKFDELDEPLRNRIGTRAKTKAPKKKDDASTTPEMVGPPPPYYARLDSPRYVPGKNGTAIKLDGDRGIVFDKLLLADRWNPWTISLWIKDTLRDPLPVILAQRCSGHDVGYNGFTLQLEDGLLEARLFRAWPENGIGVKAVRKVPKDKWSHIAWTYDGSSRPEGLKLFLNGVELETTVTGISIHKSALTETFGSGEFTVGSLFRGRGFKEGEVDEMRLFERALTQLELKELEGNKPLKDALTLANAEQARDYYFSALDQESRNLRKELEKARESLVRFEDGIVEIPVMKEMAQPRPSWLLARGAYDAPRTDKNLVTRDTPLSLPSFPKDAPRNRLGLSQWLTHPDHPLTSRVLINRIWQQFFGIGLVATAENLGLPG